MYLRNKLVSWVAIVIGSAGAYALLSVACSSRDNVPAAPALVSPGNTLAAPPPGKGGGRHDGGGSGGGGEETTTLGNNLSTPVIFAEGLGLTGLPVTDASSGLAVFANTGLRPTAAEGLTITTLPFLYLVPDAEYQTVLDGVTYYQQKTPNAWQPEWLDAKAAGEVAHATVDWADNLVRQTWTANSVIRVEVVLDDVLDTNVLSPNLPAPTRSPLMTGFNMQLLGGSGKTESWGTDGTTAGANATIYSVCPRLSISKCQGDYEPLSATCSGDWVKAVDLWAHDGLSADGPGAYAAEVNVSGKVIFGYNWQLRQMPEVIGGVQIDKSGWWRLSFSIDDGAGSVACNVALDNLYPTDLHAYYAVPVADVEPAAEEPGTDPVLYEPRLVGPTTTELDILVKSNKGGGRSSQNP